MVASANSRPPARLLGLLPGMRYSSEEAVFTPGTRLLFYTDGLTEVFRGEEEFGPERLMDEFSKCPGERADVILDSLWATIDDFADGGPQSDDMTALRCAGARRVRRYRHEQGEVHKRGGAAAIAAWL